jgi:hypothetical protein
MLYMVIERTRPENVSKVGDRFARRGRMLPEGVLYHASWLEPSGLRCFQVMEAPDPPALQTWIDRWKDLVDFEVIPVLTSAEFWADRAKR